MANKIISPQTQSTTKNASSWRDRFHCYVEALRPKQWLKNAIVLLPILFAGKVSCLKSLQATILAACAFCLASSSVYLLNDLFDREHDKLHPIKRHRPISAGKITVKFAVLAAVLLAAIAIVLSFLVRPALAFITVLYLVVMIGYNLFLKHQVILDIMTVSFGFVLRAAAGGLAANVPISSWFLLCTIFGALFLALEKRRYELATLATAENHRAVLSSYSEKILDRMEGLILPALMICYIFYSFLSVHGCWMIITVPFIFYGLARYQMLSHYQVLTGAPEEVLLKDRHIQVAVVLWLLASVGVVYDFIPHIWLQFIQMLDSHSILR